MGAAMGNGIVLFVGLFFLAGCASSGKPIDPGAATAVVKGKTTESELYQMVGRRPESLSLMPDGKKMATWIYTRAQTKAATFVPIVGLFAGGTDLDTTTLQAIISTDGVVENVLYNSSQTEVGLGGSPAPQPIPPVK